MKNPRTDNFAERRQTARDAKKALLEKIKAGKKPDAAKDSGKAERR